MEPDIKLPPPPRPIAGAIAYLLWLAALAFIVATVLGGGRP